MASAYFVTGTDTGVGKTRVTIGLMRAFRARGEQVYGMKPVAAGCAAAGDRLVNDDALEIRKHCSVPLPYSLINPVALQQPCAPHLAAESEGREIDLAGIFRAYREISSRPGFLFVEGIGGWCVPLTRSAGMNDLVKELDIPVILVVGLRLGCINHALLTRQAIATSNVPLAGWVANQMDPDYRYSVPTVSYLSDVFESPLLGVIPFLPAPGLADIDSCLETDCLL